METSTVFDENPGIMNVREIIDTAFGDFEKNTVNFKLIQTVLLIMARQLRLLERRVEVELGPLAVIHSGSSLSITEVKIHAMQKKKRKTKDEGEKGKPKGGKGRKSQSGGSGPSSSDKTSSEKTSSDKTSSGKSTSEKTSTDKTSSGKSTSDKTSTDKTSTDKTSTDKTSTDKTLSGKSTSDKTSTDKTSTDKTSSGKSTSDKTSTDKTSTDKTSSGKSTSDKTSTDKTSSGKSTSDKASTDKTSSGKSTSDKTSTDKTSSGKSTSDKTSTDKTTTTSSSKDKSSVRSPERAKSGKGGKSDRQAAGQASGGPGDAKTSSRRGDSEKSSPKRSQKDGGGGGGGGGGARLGPGELDPTEEQKEKLLRIIHQRTDSFEEATKSPTPMASVGSVEAQYEKLLVVQRVPSSESKRSGKTQGRTPQISVVTQDQFEQLAKLVRQLQVKLLPVGTPTFPEHAELMEELRKGASLTDAMAALQLSARLEATERGLERMIAMVTELAKKTPGIVLDETFFLFGGPGGATTPGGVAGGGGGGARAGGAGSGTRPGSGVASSGASGVGGAGGPGGVAGAGGGAGGAGGGVGGAGGGRAGGKSGLGVGGGPGGGAGGGVGGGIGGGISMGAGGVIVGGQSGPGTFGADMGAFGTQQLDKGQKHYSTHETSEADTTETKESRSEGSSPIKIVEDHMKIGNEFALTLDYITFDDLQTATKELYTNLMSTVTTITTRTSKTAESAYKLAMNLEGKIESALGVSSRMNNLENLVDQYAAQINALDTGLSSQMTNYQEQLTQMQHDLEIGLETMAEVLANTGGDTVAVAELNSHFTSLSMDFENMLYRQRDLKECLDSISIDLEGLWKQIEMLRDIKSDREEVADALRDKAGIGELNGLVSLHQFEAVRGDFQKRMGAAYDKFNNQEVIWQKAIDDLVRELNEKADLVQVESLKSEINKYLNIMKDRMQFLIDIVGEPKSAMLSRKLFRDTACLSCGSPAHMDTEEPCFVPKLPKLHSGRQPAEGAEAGRSMGDGDHGVCYPGLPLPHPRDPRSHICQRYCGGSHTLVNEPPARAPPEIAVVKVTREITTELGTDGKMYLVDNPEQVPCKPCNVKKKTPPPTEIIKSPCKTDYEDITPPPDSQMTMDQGDAGSTTPQVQDVTGSN